MRTYRLKFNQIAITELASNSKFSYFFTFRKNLYIFLQIFIYSMQAINWWHWVPYKYIGDHWCPSVGT